MTLFHKFVLLHIILLVFLAGILYNPSKCWAQSLTCEQHIRTETDSVTGKKMIGAKYNMVISSDGKTGFFILPVLIDGAVMLSITTLGSGQCVNRGDAAVFIFTDSSSIISSHAGADNCEAKSALYFGNAYNNIQQYEDLTQKKIASLRVWTQNQSLTRSFTEKNAIKFKEILTCLKTYLTDKNTPTGSEEDNLIFTIVEQQPQFEGGMDNMMKFIVKNLEYPAAARRSGASGTVLIQFLVSKDGSLSQVEIIRSVHPALDKEAERVVKLMPRWIPGKQKDKNVNVRFVLPIKFKYN